MLFLYFGLHECNTIFGETKTAAKQSEWNLNGSNGKKTKITQKSWKNSHDENHDESSDILDFLPFKTTLFNTIQVSFHFAFVRNFLQKKNKLCK